MKKFWIYAVGVAIAGGGYQLLKPILEPPVLFAVVVVYAVSLRLLAERFGK